MNKLPSADRARILHLLCEGQSIRAITRLTGASKNTVAKLLVDTGKACMAFHDAAVRDVKAKLVQVDEIWSFTYAKQKNAATAKAAPAAAGDTWTWTAIDADTKLIVSYFVGGRDGECAMWFMGDLASRLTNGLSKKVESYAFAVALHMMYYNFVRIHSTLRMPPAMAAGVSDRLWEISDIVALVEAEEAKTAAKRGPYKKRRLKFQTDPSPTRVNPKL
ncbi:helix-turn-helix domain-containing protein [Bosea sp. TND4EK4]|uniref:helix-turn-helix domain-containing protein n=1 Tax=Bosea sp. TND4EK4 TaxID=1907408 RepID=UPI000956D918|nr:helix-turn-helix domain-containing protein [Bosea sp. TND4EK4]SIQ83646.1 hypothetical protein SAMN05880592_10620 [Bosea sp. TND4EK4]